MKVAASEGHSVGDSIDCSDVEAGTGGSRAFELNISEICVERDAKLREEGARRADGRL